MGTREGAGHRVLDLGAGTGKLTAALVAAGLDTVAVEPDPAMLAELHATVPGVNAVPGGAQAIPLPDASVDAVVAGNAMHWFDMALAGPEIARVLVPGGTLSGLWNVLDDRVGWVADLARVSGPEAIGPRDTPARWRAETADAHRPANGDPDRFGSPERAEFPHGQRRTADTLIHTLATRAGMLTMPDRNDRRGSVRSEPSSPAVQRPPTVSSTSPCSPASSGPSGCDAHPPAMRTDTRPTMTHLRGGARGRLCPEAPMFNLGSGSPARNGSR